jgi:hypothetical protein
MEKEVSYRDIIVRLKIPLTYLHLKRLTMLGLISVKMPNMRNTHQLIYCPKDDGVNMRT